jgi:hypothetical protein
MTITGLGADTFSPGASHSTQLQRLASVVAMIVGALIGALLLIARCQPLWACYRLVGARDSV